MGGVNLIQDGTAQRKKPPVGGFFVRGVYSLTAFSTFSDADQIR